MQHKAKATINTYLFSWGLVFSPRSGVSQTIRTIPNLNQAYRLYGERDSSLWRGTR